MGLVQLESSKSDVKNGMAYVCSLCSKWLRARAKGFDQCEAAMEKKPCGGPMAKMVFPQYEGPLELSTWGDFCFRCGAASVAGVQVPGEFKVLGICEEHLEMLENMTLENSDRPLSLKHVDAGPVEMIAK